jgi:AcrR family transcriptional regulator
MEIIQKLEINPHIFYRHFPSKLELLVECFRVATPPPGPHTSGEGACTDLGEHVLHGLVLDSRWGQLSAILSVAMRSEGQRQPAMHQFSDAWQQIIDNVVRDFESVRGAESEPPPISDELLAYSLLGAHRYASVRATWDEDFRSADLLRAHLFVFLSLIAAISGEVDIYSRVARYEDLIQRLTAGKAELPPALEI